MCCFCKLQEPPITCNERVHRAAAFRTNFVNENSRMRIYRIPRRDNLVGGSRVAADPPYSGYATNENAQKNYHDDNWYKIIRTIMDSTVIEIDKVGTNQPPSKLS